MAVPNPLTINDIINFPGDHRFGNDLILELPLPPKDRELFNWIAESGYGADIDLPTLNKLQAYLEREMADPEKVLLKPNGYAQSYPFMEFTYIKGKPYVEAEKHFDKDGVFNGYNLPMRFWTATHKHFVWAESLHVYGLEVANA